MSTAIFAAGCFWGIEAEFRKIEGVLGTEVGYTGGTTRNPTYPEICAGRTGHAQAVKITFDEEIVTYQELLTVFWGVHDPTQLNRQGDDVGTQYRSAIFVLDAEQERLANWSRERMQPYFGGGIVTDIAAAREFHRAEEFHQLYYEKRGDEGRASTLRCH